LSSPVPLRSKPYPLDHFKAKTWKKSYKQDRKRSNSITEMSKSSDSFDAKEIEKNLKKDEANRNFTICLRYSGIIFQDFLDENEMVVVEQPWLSIVDTLPDALERQRYGS
jgi:U3 small nucleolar RNA-associated protein 4